MWVSVSDIIRIGISLGFFFIAWHVAKYGIDLRGNYVEDKNSNPHGDVGSNEISGK